MQTKVEFTTNRGLLFSYAHDEPVVSILGVDNDTARLLAQLMQAPFRITVEKIGDEPDAQPPDNSKQLSDVGCWPISDDIRASDEVPRVVAVSPTVHIPAPDTVTACFIRHGLRPKDERESAAREREG